MLKNAKFEKISFKQFAKDIDDGNYSEIVLPYRKTKHSAGYDFISFLDITLKPGEIKKIPTGIKVCLEDGEFLGIFVRSSMGFKYNVRMCNQVGIIDKDYYNNSSNEGHIWIKLQNHGDEDYIIKSPIRRIHKIKTSKIVRETYSDETIEKLRDGCDEIRDLAMIDFLTSTGVRVGELVRLNKNDINFEDRSCIVFGKGSKEREVYFDARTKLHLEKYLAMRNDNNPALFVSLLAPYDRLEISGVEIRLRKLGNDLELQRVHPHKFRRTMATKAIDKGMPIEQVQRLLGHAKINTTLQYAMVNQNNVKLSHHKHMC